MAQGKKEAGEDPARARHCKRRAFFRQMRRASVSVTDSIGKAKERIDAQSQKTLPLCAKDSNADLARCISRLSGFLAKIII